MYTTLLPIFKCNIQVISKLYKQSGKQCESWSAATLQIYVILLDHQNSSRTALYSCFDRYVLERFQNSFQE